MAEPELVALLVQAAEGCAQSVVSEGADVCGKYVTGPDGRTYRVEVCVERNWNGGGK